MEIKSGGGGGGHNDDDYGWKQIGVGGLGYKFKNGDWAKGIHTIDGVTYFFNPNNNKLVRDNFVKYLGNKYYIDKNGRVVMDQFVTKWGATYICQANGVIHTNGVFEYKGDLYYANKSGAIKKDALIKTDNEKIMYADPHGKLVKNKMVIKWNKKYFFDNDGYAIIRWVDYEGNLYYTEKSGAALTGVCFRTVEGAQYFFKSGGAIARNETLELWGTYYQFDEEGQVIGVWRP